MVGLGNPGQKYVKNRHNAGFLLLDELAKNAGIDFVKQSRFFGSLAEMDAEQGRLYLLKPATFMNRSGQSVSAVMKYYKISAEEVLVLHDELDFDVGVVRVKKGGGHGGHNGLRDIIASLGQKDFIRLRIGVGRPRAGKVVADYVLSDFSKVDVLQLRGVFADFAVNMPAMCGGNYDLVMQNLHSR